MASSFGLVTPPGVKAAVAIAVREATGACVTERPLSSERVARALKLLQRCCSP